MALTGTLFSRGTEGKSQIFFPRATLSSPHFSQQLERL